MEQFSNLSFSALVGGKTISLFRNASAGSLAFRDISSIAKVCCRRDFRPSVQISCSHPTKPPQQQYDASVGSYFLSIGQFSYHFQPQTLSPPSDPLAAVMPPRYSDSVRHTIETCLRAGVEPLQIASEVRVSHQWVYQLRQTLNVFDTVSPPYLGVQGRPRKVTAEVE